ncbi:MAG: hypothetical protein ACRD3I_03465, partial [Terriglobales bacterium]
MKKLFAALLVMSLALFVAAAGASDKAKATSINGWVSETGCAAKHAGAGGEACVKKCIANGAKMAFVFDADKSVWAVDNPDKLAGHEGHHVTIEAHVDKKAKSVHVETVT